MNYNGLKFNEMVCCFDCLGQGFKLLKNQSGDLINCKCMTCSGSGRILSDLEIQNDLLFFD